MTEQGRQSTAGDVRRDWDVPVIASDLKPNGRQGSTGELFDALRQEVNRQDRKHGPYQGTPLGRSRLALATLEDEAREALDAWRAERRVEGWVETRAEVLQVAAVAIRALRDAL